MSAAFLLVLFFASYAHTEAATERITEPLGEIVQVMKERNIDINHWHLYTKKNGGLTMGRKGYVRMVEGLKHHLNKFRWDEMHEDYDGNLKITGTHTDNKAGFHERLTVLAYPKDGKFGIYIVYEMEGDHWSGNHQEKIVSVVSNRIRQIHVKNPTIFTCVSGNAGATMDFVLMNGARQLVRDFGAVSVEKLEEKTFVALSAYTSQWKQSIPTRNHRMNLQVALRKTKDGNIAVTIGTPIITTEY
ncbi:MAG TPA: YwmB family TATA-box binding protein [Bacillales bacterium]|nr:YwmB family TATA-box binding protein [Bacillales bacterium]